jgi:hypothetical protein
VAAQATGGSEAHPGRAPPGSLSDICGSCDESPAAGCEEGDGLGGTRTLTPLGRRILNPLRLPIPPRGRVGRGCSRAIVQSSRDPGFCGRPGLASIGGRVLFVAVTAQRHQRPGLALRSVGGGCDKKCRSFARMDRSFARMNRGFARMSGGNARMDRLFVRMDHSFARMSDANARIGPLIRANGRRKRADGPPIRANEPSTGADLNALG